jgi:C1A family cysteine protease
MDDNYGYRLDLENRDAIIEQSPAFLLKMTTEPERVDPRPILVTEDQGSMGSCQGHSLSSCLEWCHYLATKGHYLQLSRLFAYLGSQRLDGIIGDNGSTLHGGARLAKDYGICPENILPYPVPAVYPRGGWQSMSSAAWDAAIKFKIATAQFIETEPQAKTWLAAGAGLINIGVAWGQAMTPDSRGCIKSFRPGGGGHAIVLGGYLPDAAVGVSSGDGYWYLLHNSWSKRWGMSGWAYVAPSAVRQMLESRFTTFVGLSDMTDVKPREIDFTEESVVA